MDLFSCRNCTHNPAQGLSLGKGPGYCTLWRSPIIAPEQMTCKYARRKDLPSFLVREAMTEHAESLASTVGIVPLDGDEPRPGGCEEAPTLAPPVEEVRRLIEEVEEPLLEERWRMAQVFGGSRDGRRQLIHACLARNLLSPDVPRRRWLQVGLSMVEAMADPPAFVTGQLLLQPGESEADAETAASWEVVHTVLSTLQEVGWYAAIRDLTYPLSALGEDASQEDFQAFFAALSAHREDFRDVLLVLSLEEQFLHPRGRARRTDRTFRRLSDTRSRIGGPARLRKEVR